MQAIKNKEEWDAYREEELAKARPFITTLGIVLDETQVHTGGERYLMSGRKLVLTGVRIGDVKKVVIKLSSFPEGKKEIEREKIVRDTVSALPFAQGSLLAAPEVLFEEKNGVLFFITEYIPQPTPFVSLPLEKQYFFALRTLEEQEGFHATTREHNRLVRDVFIACGADTYIASYAQYLDTVQKISPVYGDLIALMERGYKILKENKTTLERYENNLTHTDLVPHNIRVGKNGVYLIDYAAIHFGNKYEGWARFLNFMLLHNPPLEELLLSYVRANRTEDEYLCLRLMRIFKVGFLLRFYVTSLEKTSGDLRSLTEARIEFWKEVLRAILDDTKLEDSARTVYLEKRSVLRSKEEVERQKEISTT